MKQLPEREELDPRVSTSVTIPSEWSALLEVMPDAVLVSDLEGRILFANSQLEALTGYGRAELAGRPVEMLVPQSAASVHAEHRRFYYENPRTRSMGVADDIRARRKDGAEFPVDISLSMIETLKGRFVVSAIRDSTLREQAEMVARRHARISAMIEDRDRLGRRLLDGVVHELFETGMELQGTIGRMGRDDPLCARLTNTVERIDRAVTDIRRFVFDAGFQREDT